ncbi:carboxymuconolactone decarboxylase family protein [Humibacter albus]|uniref:carboxymuconolactone decarboxylase family protein n=1 Tax=Humibacter albus TaxID=427754 RepID=UPI00042A3BFA|nr:carboxymuconolactone decarboxylase family protein [Humibacter albus]
MQILDDREGLRRCRTAFDSRDGIRNSHAAAEVDRRSCAACRTRALLDVERRRCMADSLYHPTSPEIAQRRKDLAPGIHDAFEAFSRSVFADGALPEQTKQLIAVAVAHTTQCPYCIQGHTRLAHRAGATDEQIMEAIWVAAEMRAGGAYAHSTLALDVLEKKGHHD